MASYRKRRYRRAIVWLTRANEPTAWHLQWYENGDMVREIYNGCDPSIELDDLVNFLDQIPRSVDFSLLRVFPHARGRTGVHSVHRIKFDLPGWAAYRADVDWLYGVQQSLIPPATTITPA